MVSRRNVIAATTAAGFAAAFATLGAALGLASTLGIPVTAINDANSGSDPVPAGSRNLAEAVDRWNSEYPESAPGAPLTERAVLLLRGVGREQDTIVAFPTARGRVCFEIRAAGTCGHLDARSGVTFATLFTRSGGTRVFGVAADDVTRVEVQVNGVLRDAILRNNGFHYQLPVATASGDVEYVRSTWRDGRTAMFPVHPK